MTQNRWAVICPERKAPGVWGTWLHEHCVAVGWPPSRYHMEGHTDHEGWDIARNRLPMVAAGDIVIPYLMHNRFGVPGKVTSVAVSDADWKPTVEKGRYRGNLREAELGRRIYVEWMSNGTLPSDKIAIVPRKMRHANGEVHQSIEPLNPQRFGRFMDILKDRKNWRDYQGDTERSTKRTDNTPTPDKIHLKQGKTREPATAASLLTGNRLYLERARDAFPMLVRQAVANETIYYSDLADELKMANPRNLNYVLGAIGKSIKELATEWKEEIPPLQCLVVNKNTGLPGEGVEWFISDLKDFKNRTPEERRQILDIELVKVFNYVKWREVLAAFNLKPLMNDPTVAALVAKAGQGGGVGECEDHRALKNFVANNPNVIGLSGFSEGTTEYCFPSADRIDVAFQDGERWVGVEVKGPSSPDADIVRGLFQTVKYIALREAELKSGFRKGQTEVILVLSRRLPAHLKQLKNLLGVNVVDGVAVPVKDESNDLDGAARLHKAPQQ